MGKFELCIPTRPTPDILVSAALIIVERTCLHDSVNRFATFKICEYDVDLYRQMHLLTHSNIPIQFCSAVCYLHPLYIHLNGHWKSGDVVLCSVGFEASADVPNGRYASLFKGEHYDYSAIPKFGKCTNYTLDSILEEYHDRITLCTKLLDTHTSTQDFTTISQICPDEYADHPIAAYHKLSVFLRLLANPEFYDGMTQGFGLSPVIIVDRLVQTIREILQA